MPTITTLPLTIIRGVEFTFRFRWKGPDALPIDTSSGPLVWAFRLSETAEPLFEIENDGVENSNGSVFMLEDPDTMKWLVRLSNKETLAFKKNDGYWWLRWGWDDDLDHYITGGRLTIRNP
jgi:hypothetical protein